MRAIVLFVFVLSWISCNNNPGTTTASDGAGVDLSNYVLHPIEGTAQQYVVRGQEIAVEEEGFILEGRKEGTWVTYHLDALHIPKTIASYVNGKLHGYYAEFNSRGQLELSAVYKQGLLHGRYAKYKYGFLLEQHYYKENVLHGMLTTYYPNTKKLQKEVEFKNGKEDGFYRYYNEDGQVTLEYEYKNGEKVKGGMVEGAN